MTSDLNLRLGDYRDVLADYWFDAVITDPPYGMRTHEGWNEGEAQVRDLRGQATRTAIAYDGWTEADVATFVAWAAARCRGWIVVLTSHDLIPAYERAYHQAGRYAFAPVPIIQKRPRLLGDGPASWAVYAMVARPRTAEFRRWRCLPGAYEAPCVTGIVAGAKPVDLMRALVRDYSRPADLVCDPCAGGATTLLAAAFEGRRGMGAERDPSTYDKAIGRIASTAVPVRPLIDESESVQTDLWRP